MLLPARKAILPGMLCLALLGLLFYSPNLYRMYRVITLFDEDKIASNFLDMQSFLNTAEIKASKEPHRFEVQNKDIPQSFAYRNRRIDTEEFFKENRTTGIIVVHNGKITAERYLLGHSRSNPHISWSVAKSVISALFGIALEEGKINNLDEQVTNYVPELKGSGYEGVTIKNTLQMATGVSFDENYEDFFSDINRFGRAIALGTSLDEFSGSLSRNKPPGTKLDYVSINTQVLGMVITRATGLSLTKYTEEKLWQPLGMGYDAYWITDNQGMELALGGLNATLRDYARFGLLYAQGGKWNGQQIISERWLDESLTPGAPYLMPGRKGTDLATDFGYGYHWWVPGNADDEFMARGVYGQFIYIDPDAGVVVAQNSANHLYNEKAQVWDEKHLAFFREIVRSLTITL